MPEIVIATLSGGLNDSDPPIALSDDCCVRAENVEFHRSMLGERRLGAEEIDLSGSGIEVCEQVAWMHRHLPTSTPSDAQLWALGITYPSTAVLAYKDTTWHTVSMPDPIILDGASEYQIRGITLHGKLFIAYNSGVDRLHVWDGTSLRRVGLSPLTTAPTSADTGFGSFATTRYYRVRETVQVSSVTTLRSEPSDVLTDTPSGSGTGLVVTRPTATNSNATHWELEASLNNADFYVIATTAIGTTTATDSTAAATGYGAFDLSEDIGDYYPPHSAKILLADEDRLLMCGSFEDADLSSSVSWTPVYNATGVGNDERITLDPVSVVNLDGFEGGAIADAGRWAQGEIGVFKQAHVYKMIRTGNRQRAYDAFAVSKQVGAVNGSVVEGVDDAGNAALYFLDPSVGPYRFTVRGGLQWCGGDIRETWSTVYLDAEIVARSLYYRAHQQVWWCVATNDSQVPNLGLRLQVNAMQPVGENGQARRGFTTVTGPSTSALTMCLFSDNIDDDTDRSRALVPFIGVTGDGLLWRCDTGHDDNGTAYAARITTKPYAPTHLQTDCEVKSATLVAKATTDADVVLSVIVNGGVSTTQVGEDIDLTPAGSETFVIRHLDDLSVAECQTVQFDFADVASPAARWELARLSATLSSGQGR